MVEPHRARSAEQQHDAGPPQPGLLPGGALWPRLRRAHRRRPAGRGRAPGGAGGRVRPERAQPPLPAGRGLPLVRRGRHGPRRPPGGRAGHLPQPLRADRRPPGLAGRWTDRHPRHPDALPARRDAAGSEHRQHRPHLVQRRPTGAVVARGLSLCPLPARAEDAAARGPGRHAAHRGGRPPQGRSAHRRAGVLRLLRLHPALPALRGRLGGRAGHPHPGPRPPPALAPARHRHHRAPHHPDGPADAVGA